MSRSTTPATRNEATQSWNTPRVTPFAKLPKGTAIRTYLRTVANGCGRLRTVADGCERKRNVRRTQLYPHTPRVKREPLLRIREKTHSYHFISISHEMNPRISGRASSISAAGSRRGGWHQALPNPCLEG